MSVCSAETRAREAAGQLTAATGNEARTTETPDAFRVEVDVPDGITTESLIAIVTALDAADHYGHDQTATTDVAWAEFTKELP